MKKFGEFVIGTPPYKKRKRKRRRTKEEKEFIVQKFDEIIEKNKRILNPLLSSKKEDIEEWSDEEIARQRVELCNHEETFDNGEVIICRFCGVKLEKRNRKKAIRNLFCRHKEIEEYNDDYIICTKCGAKFRKNRNVMGVKKKKEKKNG